MKKIILFIFLFIFQASFSQEKKPAQSNYRPTNSLEENRMQQIKNNIDAISVDAPGLSEKININIKEASLSSFLLAISQMHKLNISVAPNLAQTNIVNNFADVNVGDLLLFLCKEYNLTIDFSGSIIAIKSYQKPAEKKIEKVFEVKYEVSENLLSLNLKEDLLYDVFKRITDESGKNLVYAPGLEKQVLTAYIKSMPFDAALDKLALANNLTVKKSKDSFYIFDSLEGNSPNNADKNGTARSGKSQNRKSNFQFTVIDVNKKILDVDFENTPIASIVYDIGHELDIDMFISSPLEGAGNATVKAKNISFDALLSKIFETKTEAKTENRLPSNNGTQRQLNNDSPAESGASGDSYTFMKSGTIYYFGTKNQLIVRNVKSIPLMHRSIELLGDSSNEGRSSGRLNNTNTNVNNYANNNNINGSDSRNTSNFQQQNNYNNTSNNSSGNSNPSESILTIIPDEIKKDLDIKIDKELNSFLVNGPAANIERFESFIKYIDKAVPVILIEVMLLEVNKSATVETGINAGIGDKPVTTSGTVFPTVDMNLGAQTINNIIDGFSGFGSLNIGKVVPNFYVNLKAMETNGNLKIRSSPRLSTLNGHKAFLSIGETTYYVVTNQNFYGSQIPTTSEIKNYQPIDAELSVTIMPLVSGDGQITLDIKVIQSSFNGQKVDKNAPPGINSREFTSIIRVKDQDLIVLGGLEESTKNDSGTGVPLLSRIPIIKWLFSSRSRQDSKKKLTVLIKPTVIY
ncbi:type II secretion system protein GspD [Flavobacterium eburneipallidum]|uniref:type II secretion system protein GspD n=1 Tax=Flavobacterium eburneipallidum TaxID=3003263 RepID=UPI002482248D|nr:general secretion pathway protein GspD [Flavobacterium eburneipallidum]